MNTPPLFDVIVLGSEFGVYFRKNFVSAGTINLTTSSFTRATRLNKLLH